MVNKTIEKYETLQNELEVEVAKLIRERLENSSIDFIGGNALDILIDTNVDIDSIVNQAYIIPKNTTYKQTRKLERELQK